MSSKSQTRTTYSADLHMHSTCSDGRLNPEELVELVARSGVKTMALTDHDTVAGLARARDACALHGVTLVNGVELTVFWGKEVHLLGYFIDPEHPVLKSGLETRIQARIDRVREICHRLDRLGYVVYPDQIIARSGVTVGRPHVARAMVEAGHVQSEDEAFMRFLRNGGSAYVPASPISLELGLDWIHASGGLASIAHPSVDKLTSKLAILADMGVDAVEVRHPSQPPAVQGQLYSTARHLKLQVTGGSDLHAPTEYRRPGIFGVTDLECERLRQHAQRYQNTAKALTEDSQPPSKVQA